MPTQFSTETVFYEWNQMPVSEESTPDGPLRYNHALDPPRPLPPVYWHDRTLKISREQFERLCEVYRVARRQFYESHPAAELAREKGIPWLDPARAEEERPLKTGNR
ncbi:MAG TPA: hypothetical protein VF593_08205 [Chthoniobacteraceae bacterium]|jgi:hypothetical protein